MKKFVYAYAALAVIFFGFAYLIYAASIADLKVQCQGGHPIGNGTVTKPGYMVYQGLRPLVVKTNQGTVTVQHFTTIVEKCR